METPNIFYGNNEAEVWQKVEADLLQNNEFLNYTALLNLNGQETLLDIDIDLGGGFESGFSTTMFQAKIPYPVALRFNIHEQDLLNEVGKIFGLEDIKLGYPEFDEAFIIQTNEPDTVKAIFEDKGIRDLLLQHPDAKLELGAAEDELDTYLQFTKDDAIVEAAALRDVYHLLQYILRKIESGKLH